MDYRQADYHEEISHLTYWHRVRTITHDAEDAEESESDTHCCLSSIQPHHQIDQEEDGHRYNHKGEVEVATLALPEIEKMDYHPVHQHTDEKSH